MPDPAAKYTADQCLGDVERTAGYLWSSVIIRTASTTIEIRGLDGQEAKAWFDALNRWQRSARLASLAPLRAELTNATVASEDLWSGQHFVRQSGQQALLDRLSALIRATNQTRWAVWADVDDRALQTKVIESLARAPRRRDAANEEFRHLELSRFGALFDQVESKPLTAAQRRACVSLDDNTLVLAGAGTGKTSVMIARMAYLLESGAAHPGQMLAVAYNRDARDELRARADARLSSSHSIGEITIETFHSLGMMIIATVENRKPTVSRMATDEHAREDFLKAAFEALLEDPAYLTSYLEYAYHYEETFQTIFDFDTAEDYERDLNGRNRRALDGTLLRSAEEQQITNWLIRQGAVFEYEALYPIDTATATYSAYRPDFTIRLSRDSEAVVFLEHFGVDQNGKPPPFFSPTEAARYRQGMEWKRQLHVTQKTVLIETYSYEFRNGTIFNALAERLRQAGVVLSPRSDEELLKILAERNVTSGFLRLCANGITTGRELNSFADLPAKILAAPERDRQRSQLLARLVQPLRERYEVALTGSREVDFAEMLHRATRYVAEGRFRSPFRHILVDEFQDISEPRAALVKALRDQVLGASLCCVGDDWQSIYRFSGSDVRFTTEFADRIGPGTTVSLDQTFRFNDQIGSVATAFVTRNPAQSRKEIASTRLAPKPAVSLVSSGDAGRALRAIIGKLEGWATERGETFTVRVLARYHYELEEARRLTARSPGSRLSFTCSTVHGAKGLEADFVIVVGLGKGREGFPAEKPSDPFLNLLVPPIESFPHAEERRLFYVALTRARHRVYLVYDREACSIFVTELSAGDYRVVTDEFRAHPFHQPETAHVPCPRCATGELRVRSGTQAPFIGCNRYPLCAYTERGCGDCGGILMRAGTYRVCADMSCSGVHLACPECGSPMQRRDGPYGPFFGCGNYGKADIDLRCTGKARIHDLPEASVLRASLPDG